MGNPFRDVADSSAASYRPDIAAEIDTPEDMLREILANAAARWTGRIPQTALEFRSVIASVALDALKDAIARGSLADLFDLGTPPRSDLETSKLILAEILGDKNPRLQAKCIDFVFGFGVAAERTETDIGATEGVGRAAVSQRCVTLRETFGLPEVPGMKGDHARDTYRRIRTGKRKQREAWGWAGLLRGVYHGV
jgi:hypothetical protein